MCGPTGVGFLYGKTEILDEMPPFLGSGFKFDVTGSCMLVWQSILLWDTLQYRNQLSILFLFIYNWYARWWLNGCKILVPNRLLSHRMQLLCRRRRDDCWCFPWSFNVRQATHTVSGEDFNALSSSRFFVSSPNIMSSQIHCSVQLRISYPLTWVTYVLGIVNCRRFWLRRCCILDVHVLLLERICYRSRNWVTWCDHLITWYSESYVFADLKLVHLRLGRLSD